MKNHRFTRTAAIGALGLLILLASCDTPPAPSAQLDRPVVIAPIYAVAAIIRQIGGDAFDVRWWVEAGQSLDELTETLERRNQLRTADLVITRGAADPWTLDGLGNQYETLRLVRLDSFPAARDTDPRLYLWLDWYLALELSDELANRMSTLAPRSEKAIRANAAQFRRDVLAAVESARPVLDSAPAKFVTFDEGFLPLTRRMALEEQRIVDADFTRPSPHAIKVIQQTARDAAASTVFVNALTPPAQVRDWEAQLGLKVLPLEAFGSSAPASGRSTYVDVLKYNLAQLSAGLSRKTPATTAP